jgi:hypothetical protein
MLSLSSAIISLQEGPLWDAVRGTGASLAFSGSLSFFTLSFRWASEEGELLLKEVPWLAKAGKPSTDHCKFRTWRRHSTKLTKTHDLSDQAAKFCPESAQLVLVDVTRCSWRVQQRIANGCKALNPVKRGHGRFDTWAMQVWILHLWVCYLRHLTSKHFNSQFETMFVFIYGNFHQQIIKFVGTNATGREFCFIYRSIWHLQPTFMMITSNLFIGICTRPSWSRH